MGRVMTDEEEGVWRTITKGLSTNDPIQPAEVLGWAIALGRTVDVPEERVREIFDAVRRGVLPGTDPL